MAAGWPAGGCVPMDRREHHPPGRNHGTECVTDCCCPSASRPPLRAAYISSAHALPYSCNRTVWLLLIKTVAVQLELFGTEVARAIHVYPSLLYPGYRKVRSKGLV